MALERDRRVRPSVSRSPDAVRLVRDQTMSATDAQRTTSPNVVLEKTVLTEILQLYQSFPCLWDQKHMLYGNKEEREKAYDVLLGKFKLIQSDAMVYDVKKKIEYMRCAYRREHKKVIMCHLRGVTHRPTLWYYDLLAFLNDHNRDIKIVKTEELQETHEIVDSDEEISPIKRRKTVSKSSENVVYLSEQHHNMEELEGLSENYQEQDQSSSFIISNEAEAFGRTLGYQLKELNHMQRVFAEKLISDVIYQARLCNLSAETTLNLHIE